MLRFGQPNRKTTGVSDGLLGNSSGSVLCSIFGFGFSLSLVRRPIILVSVSVSVSLGTCDLLISVFMALPLSGPLPLWL